MITDTFEFIHLPDSHRHKYSTRPNFGFRNGQVDQWNAFMVEHADFSQNDIPYCPSTMDAVPAGMISYEEAKTIYRKAIRTGDADFFVNAYIHFYIDDQKFDGKRSSIWLFPDKAYEIIRHFAGIISPDFSTYADFPRPWKLFNHYRMNAFGFWISSLNIPVIPNVRWGDEQTWEYCFDGLPCSSTVAIGSVASGIRKLENRPFFQKGLLKMVEVLRPSMVIIYGSSNYSCFEILRQQGIKIVSYNSKTSDVFAGRSYE